MKQLNRYFKTIKYTQSVGMYPGASAVTTAKLNIIRYFALPLLMLLGLSIPTKAQNFTYNGVNYSVWSSIDKTVAVSDNRSATGDIIIPSEVQYNGNTYSVNNIYSDAFRESTITSIELCANFKYLSDNAFSGCEELEKIVIPNSVETIGMSCFYDCKNLKSVKLGENVRSLGHHSFRDCEALTEIIIPNSVETIGQCCFLGCTSLNYVSLSENIKSLNINAFSLCESLEEIVIPGSVETIDKRCFWGCKHLKLIQFSDNIKELCDYAFDECESLEEIIIPNSVEIIGVGCFLNCKSLKKVNLGENIKSIGSSLFSGCELLEEIVVPNSVQTMGSGCFYNCKSLKSVKLNGNIEDLGAYSFMYCSSLEEITIPNSVKNIESGCFSYCNNLKSVQLGENVQYLGYMAFMHCISLSEIIIPNSVVFIDEYCFWECYNLKTVKLSESLKSLEYFSFNHSGLTEVVIPNSVDTIGFACFSGCEGLERVQLGVNLKVLKSGAFDYCKKLREITIPNSVEYIGSRCFDISDSLSIVHLGNNVKYLGDSAFYFDERIREIDLPQSVTYIGNTCFKYCGLSILKIPYRIQKIEFGCIQGCWNLNNLQLGKNVAAVDSVNFANLYNLQSVVCMNSTPPTVSPVKNTVPANATLYVPVGSVNDYRNADFWKSFSNIEGREEVAKPLISVDGRYINITAESGAKIYYSVNDGGYQLYDGRVELNGFGTVKAFAVKDGYIDSDETTFQRRSYGTETYMEITDGGSLDEAYLWADAATRENILRNPNLLAYVANNSLASDLYGKVSNIIVNGEAERINISNDWPWHCPKEFEATNVSYTRNFSMLTAINGGCAGWETIALPFDVKTITYSNGSLYPFASNNDPEAHRFWLYEPTTYEWQAATTIEANTPYLIAMPNNPVYYDPFNITGEVTFSAQGVTIPATPANLSYDFRDGYHLNVNYLKLAADTQLLVVNDKAVDGHEPGSCFVADERAVRPFEAYLTAPGQNRVPIFNTTSLSEGLMTEMALRVWCDTPQSVSISAPFDAKVNIYDISGRAVRTVKVNAGENVRITDLPSGLYIIAKTKIAILR